ncbi:RHS repeat domain-containing protein [Vibrio parahaemolyticus]|uniref:RHS repeat domain-containing protein n=1 Tax=Vibrio parahaemolyticus TaxID=670 RepID=UPI0004DF6BF9|nr:hypothetical protein [Vibrio parahaemolyticus]HAS6129861.1 hypothetical protein [Vibrio vulnificus]MDF4257152.1 hypothetical protein [Vibrio parahaemolyticus]MDF4262366.1 hypothetical protein [Vibrio parahaemolyticus]MDK9427110.1 hypothetical protein [Vibrio parahaemolyticus]MDK9435335.1 hypothetical protein [Vibrio parahaemolyticus]
MASFNPIRTRGLKVRGTVRLTAVQGAVQGFELGSSSSGLAYGLAQALAWGQAHSLHLGYSDAIPDIPVFATGELKADGSLVDISRLQSKVHHACDFAKAQGWGSDTPESPAFYILAPEGSLEAASSSVEWSVLTQRVVSLGGQIVGVTHLREALRLLLGERFDGGKHSSHHQGFLGLEPISYENQSHFMGREMLVKQMQSYCRLARDEGQVFCVQGPSGSGKSSAVMAGLLPALEKESQGQLAYRHTVVRPGGFDSVDALLLALLGTLTKDEQQVAQWLPLTETPKAFAKAVGEYLCQSVAEEAPTPLWVIDQYEELFTQPLIPRSEAHQLFACLSALAKERCILIVMVLRREYYDELEGPYHITFPLKTYIPPTELSDIVGSQVDYHELSLQSELKSDTQDQRPHLLKRMIDDAAGKPLTTVALMLKLMYEQMKAENPTGDMMTHAHYESLGGIDGVMAKQVALAIESGTEGLNEVEQERALHGFFEAFVGIDEDKLPVARVLPKAHLSHYSDQVQALIRAFMDKGLVVDANTGSTRRLKLAHDSLLGSTVHEGESRASWPDLETWFHRHEAYLTWLGQISLPYSLWLSREGEVMTPEMPISEAMLESGDIFIGKDTIASMVLKQYLEQCRAYYSREVYCAFLDERWCVPHPVIELSEAQRQGRMSHYKLTYHGEQLKVLTHCHSSGALKADKERSNAAKWVYDYAMKNDERQLHEITEYDERGQLLRTIEVKFTEERNRARLSFKAATTSGKQFATDSYAKAGQGLLFELDDDRKLRARSQITQEQLVVDASGRVKLREYFNSYHAPTGNGHGVYGISYEYDANGLMSEQHYLGCGGVPTSVKGVSARYQRRDATTGSVLKTEYRGLDGELVISPEYFAYISSKYDGCGNVIEQAYFGVDGEPCLNKDGVARITWGYDAQGRVIVLAYFGVDGKAYQSKYGVERATVEYDAQGRVIEESYFGVDDQPCLAICGVARVTLQYDAQGNEEKRAFLGVDGKLCLDKNGVASIISEYDARGNVIEQAYLGIDGEACLHKVNGMARVTLKYDAQGNVIEEAFFGVDDKACLSKYGFARATFEYDVQGNVIEEAYFGVDGKPGSHKIKGIARLAVEYDPQGNVIEEAFFGVDDKACLSKYGFARATLEYDPQGNVIEEAFFGVDRKPCLSKGGPSLIRFYYGNYSRVIRQELFDTHRQPLSGSLGPAQIVFIRDDMGALTEKHFLNAKGNLVKLTTQKFCKIKYKDCPKTGIRKAYHYAIKNRKEKLINSLTRDANADEI